MLFKGLPKRYLGKWHDPRCSRVIALAESGLPLIRGVRQCRVPSARNREMRAMEDVEDFCAILQMPGTRT
jgi:hypothetical protein